MTDENFDKQAKLIAASLRAHDVRAMNILKRALRGFDPITALPDLGKKMAEKLVGMGLAERGAATSSGGAIGYRLSELGWRVLEARSNLPKPAQPLKMVEPLVKTMPPRIKTIR